MDLLPQEWLQTVRQEYLQRFVGQGGAAVKFLVAPTDRDRELVGDQLQKVSREENFTCVSVNAKETKIHMMDKFFHQVARHIQWDALAAQFVRRLLQENGYKVPESRHDFSLTGIARMNERAEPLLRRDLNSWLERAIYRDTHMCQEFRLAMIRLCLGQMDADSESPFMAEPVKAWLQGELRQISALKEALIFQKIVRTNARYMFASLSRWLRVVGQPGLVLTLDLDRCLVTKKPDMAEGVFYSISATLDAYEMLRQFIDGTDDLEGVLFVVLVPPEFLTDSRRGLDRYEALKLRIWDEVRDRRYQNPLGALLRLSSYEQEPAAVSSGYSEGGQPAMANGNVAHQRAIEALRSGVPNRDVVEVLGSRQPDIEGKFRRLLQQMGTQVSAGIPTPGLVIEGGFGCGKSHLLKTLQHVAVEQNFVCSPVVISKETPLYNAATLFRSAINSAVVPGKNGDALTEISSELNFQSPQFVDFFSWAHQPGRSCDPRLAATLYLYERMVNDPELSHRLIRYWAGDPMSNSQLKKYLQGCPPEIPYVFEKISTQDLFLQRFQFVSRLITAAGYRGWILLIDEAEIIGRYSFKQRMKSYMEMARWLGMLEQSGYPAIGAVVALTDDFQVAVLDEKLDSQKIAQLSELSTIAGGSAEAADAMKGIRFIEERGEMLIRPYDSMVDELYDRVRTLHSSAYSWEAPQVSAVEKLASTRMREYVRGWITEWDLRRLYPDAQLDIEITEIRQHYEEDQVFDVLPSEEGEKPAESSEAVDPEDALLAVALQNQSQV